MRGIQTSRHYFLFHKIYNLLLQKFLIKVSLVQAFLIKHLQSEAAESAPSISEPLKSVLLIWLVNSFPSTWKNLCNDIMFYVFTTESSSQIAKSARKRIEKMNHISKKGRMQTLISQSYFFAIFFYCIDIQTSFNSVKA